MTAGRQRTSGASARAHVQASHIAASQQAGPSAQAPGPAPNFAVPRTPAEPSASAPAVQPALPPAAEQLHLPFAAQQQQQQSPPSRGASRGRRSKPAAQQPAALLQPAEVEPEQSEPGEQHQQQQPAAHPQADAAAEPAQRPLGAHVADETEAALRTLILGAVKHIQELKAVTSSELCDYIQAAYADTVAMQAEVAADAADTAPRHDSPAGGAPAEAWFRVGGRRGGISGDRPSALKALLQRSSLHELLAVLQASHQFVEVRDPRDTQVPQQLAKAYRLHARARVPSPADLATNVRTLLRSEPARGEGENHEPIEEVVGRAVAVQQAKFGLLVAAVATLTEAGCASAGRVREVLPLAGPPTLAAWLAARRPQMLQRYCLARLAKEGRLEVKDLGGGGCANLVRYRMAGPPPPAAELKAAHRVLKRVAREEAPPRHVPPPHKRPCTAASAAASQPQCRSGPAAAAGLRESAAAAAGASDLVGTAMQPAAAAAAGVRPGSGAVPDRLLRRIEEHHAMLAPVLRHT